jgi:hypothetical protein
MADHDENDPSGSAPPTLPTPRRSPAARWRTLLLIGVGVVVVLITVAALALRGRGTVPAQNAAANFTACMRQHGVILPAPPSGGTALPVGGGQANAPSIPSGAAAPPNLGPGVGNTSGAAFQSALRSCSSRFPGAVPSLPAQGGSAGS